MTPLKPSAEDKETDSVSFEAWVPVRTELPTSLSLFRELSNEKQVPADSFLIDFMHMNALPV